MSSISFAMTFAMGRLYKYLENRYEAPKISLCDRVDEAELTMVEIEYMIDQKDEDQRRTDNLTDYARRFHCGLILYGGFVEEQAPDTLTIISHDMLGGTHAGNYLTKRRLEDMRSIRGDYHGHSVTIQTFPQKDHYQDDSSQETQNM